MTCHEYFWIKKNTGTKVFTSQISMTLGKAKFNFLPAFKNIAISRVYTKIPVGEAHKCINV